MRIKFKKKTPNHINILRLHRPMINSSILVFLSIIVKQSSKNNWLISFNCW